MVALVACALIFAPVARLTADPAPKPRAGAAPVVNEDLARQAGLSPREVSDAARLYTAKCMRCHKSYDPAAYPQPAWDGWMIKMRKKAHLAAGQEKLLSRYLGAYRSANNTNLVASEITSTAG